MSTTSTATKAEIARIETSFANNCMGELWKEVMNTLANRHKSLYLQRAQRIQEILKELKEAEIDVEFSLYSASIYNAGSETEKETLSFFWQIEMEDIPLEDVDSPKIFKEFLKSELGDAIEAEDLRNLVDELQVLLASFYEVTPTGLGCFIKISPDFCVVQVEVDMAGLSYNI